MYLKEGVSLLRKLIFFFPEGIRILWYLRRKGKNKVKRGSKRKICEGREREKKRLRWPCIHKRKRGTEITQ